MDMFARNLGVKVIAVDASEQFLGHLKGVTDPEAKRKIIGREFVEVFQSEAKKLPAAKWLAQGTIYPDVIESAGSKTGKAKSIKSHHNVGGLPETLNLNYSNRYANYSKTKSANSASRLGYRAKWSIVTRSLAPAWACEFWVK